MIAFVKMHAQGNDFVVIGDGRTPPPPVDAQLARAICARRFGIGCDQLLVLAPANGADAAMTIFNADGSTAQNCGNGVRCAGWWLMEQLGKGAVRLALCDRTVAVRRSQAGVRAELGPVVIEARTPAYTDLRVGNPHRVWWQTPPEDALEMPSRNFEIVGGESDEDLWIEIIERGVGRTLACGSGAAAAAAALWVRREQTHPVRVHMPGGVVRVSGSLENVVIEAPAYPVFTGRFDPATLLAAQEC
ncbi:MAG: diaminopimelate epimerase, partial [Zetaproteobacteria bacterium]